MYRKPDTWWQHDAALNGGMTYREPARTTTRRIRIRRTRVAGLLVVIAAIAAALGYHLLASSSPTATSTTDALRSEHRGGLARVASTVWPADGQAAFVQTGQSQVHAGPNQHAAAIASVAKVMTAYLVLRDHPLRPGQDGPTITLTDADVADTDRRRGQRESVVSITAGERLAERQALQALLLPSANNIAAVLARWDAGSADQFVVRMNATARSLGMTHTRYTDPSGYDDATVSTAADQVRIVDRAMHLPVFASIVATPNGDAAGRRHRAQHRHIARAQRVCRRQDRLGRGGRRLLRLPGHPLDRRQTNDDHRGGVGPARPRPDRGGSRGCRRHGRPHRR
jgi:serine-type D-Ala-D-Ala carboxypeptidase (penicillin-binding protein 5/6)